MRILSSSEEILNKISFSSLKGGVEVTVTSTVLQKETKSSNNKNWSNNISTTFETLDFLSNLMEIAVVEFDLFKYISDKKEESIEIDSLILLFDNRYGLLTIKMVIEGRAHHGSLTMIDKSKLPFRETDRIPEQYHPFILENIKSLLGEISWQQL